MPFEKTNWEKVLQEAEEKKRAKEARMRGENNDEKRIRRFIGMQLIIYDRLFTIDNILTVDKIKIEFPEVLDDEKSELQCLAVFTEYKEKIENYLKMCVEEGYLKFSDGMYTEGSKDFEYFRGISDVSKDDCR